MPLTTTNGNWKSQASLIVKNEDKLAHSGHRADSCGASPNTPMERSCIFDPGLGQFSGTTFPFFVTPPGSLDIDSGSIVPTTCMFGVLGVASVLARSCRVVRSPKL